MNKVDGYGPTLKSRIPERMKAPKDLYGKGPTSNGVKEPVNKPADKDYKVDLSSRSKELGESLKASSSDISTPDLPSTPELDTVADEIGKEAVKETAKKAVEKATKVNRREYGSLEEPGVFFISGFELFGTSSTDGHYDGIGQMAAASNYGQIFSWDQKEEILDAIYARKSNQPLVLVGHSLGGDTAMEIAEELNSAENKFRTVDLVITLDSVGYDNDVVPENVRANFNFSTEGSWLGILSDSPNIAKDYQKTFVQNFLRKEDHTELDNAQDIQKGILASIDELTNRSV